MQGRRVVPPALLRGVLLGTIASAGLGSVAWGGFIPGGGPERSDCYTQLYVADVESPGPRVKRKRIVSCTDGDPCDSGRCGNNACEFTVGVCVGQTDPNLPSCKPARLRYMTHGVRRLGVPGRDFEPDYVPRRSLLTNAFPWEQRSGHPSCGQPVGMTVQGRVTKDGRKFPGRLEISLGAFAMPGTSPASDRDTFILECLPRTTPCPEDPPPTTTTTLPDISTNPTVIVGAGGGIRFDPETVRIRAGDTVRWVWEGSGYDITSTASSTSPESRFCFPRCDGVPDDHVLAGTVYEHTFPGPGTFEYGTTYDFIMEGRVIVEP
jgi:plastocyanin